MRESKKTAVLGEERGKREEDGTKKRKNRRRKKKEDRDEKRDDEGGEGREMKEEVRGRRWKCEGGWKRKWEKGGKREEEG